MSFAALSRKNLISGVYEWMERELNEEELSGVDTAFAGASNFDMAATLVLSGEGIDFLSTKAMDLHLLLIHNARLKMIRHLLPPGDLILDLGGANSPLYRMGYPHAFERLVLIDLPTSDRHVEFQEVVLEDASAKGEIVVRYEDMTELSGIASDSVDLVWSGQSIEHVSPEQGRRMCAEAFRVLKPGGHFCLDTPNRLLTRLHTAWSGGGFIHADHKVEYTPDELRALLQEAGFAIDSAWGVCEMPLSVRSGQFQYEDFLVGGAISSNIDDCYIQFFDCMKTPPAINIPAPPDAPPLSRMRRLLRRR